MHIRTLAAAAALCGAAAAQAAIQVDSADFGYSQSFDTLASSGSANAWGNNSTLTGWSLFNAFGAAITTYRADASAGNTAGAFYSFGTPGDRALGGTASGGAYFGSPASGAIAGYIAVAFTNATNLTITDFTLGFNGEQWRNGGNTSAQTMAVEYGFGPSFGTVDTWTAPGAGFDWASPVTGSSAALVDGNGVGRVTGLGGMVETTWAPGETLWIRWIERNDLGNDHGLAIDDVTLTVTAVPEPGTWALMAAGLLAVGRLARRRA